MIRLLILALLPWFCRFPGPGPTYYEHGRYAAVRYLYWTKGGGECQVFRRNVGQVCWFDSAGGRIIEDQWCVRSDVRGKAEYSGGIFELPDVVMPIPRGLRRGGQ